tara:strand:+ start:2525 stop:2707 length:183 start_codon:yes stop_codon:yes gene_type:complete
MKLRKVPILYARYGRGYTFRKYDPVAYHGHCFDSIERGYYQNDKRIGYNEYQFYNKEFYI